VCARPGDVLGDILNGVFEGVFERFFEGVDQRGPDALAPAGRVHHDLPGGGLAGPVSLEVGIAREVRAGIREEVRGAGGGPGGESTSGG